MLDFRALPFAFNNDILLMFAEKTEASRLLPSYVGHELCTGFWRAGRTTAGVTYDTYVPLVLRNRH